MAFVDPAAHLRTNDIRPRFNDAEYQAVLALAALNRSKPATFVRDLVLRYLKVVEQQAISASAQTEGTNLSLVRDRA